MRFAKNTINTADSLTGEKPETHKHIPNPAIWGSCFNWKVLVENIHLAARMHLASATHRPFHPTAHSYACSSLIRPCLFVFISIGAYAHLWFLSIPLPSLNTFSSEMFFELLSPTLADKGTWGFMRECLKRGHVWCKDSCPWFSLRAARHRHSCQALPAMHQYSSASQCDKIYHTGEKRPLRSAKVPIAQSNLDSLP